jgi:ABC-type cobalt transport system, permease component CbiQ and related transporters
MFRKNDSPDAFSGYHPGIPFLYFCFILFMTAFFTHPAVLAVSMVSALVYSVILNGMPALKFTFLELLPLMLVVALMNPLFSHSGVTILFYLNENPVTLESIVFGAVSAAAFFAVILVFSCFNKVMTSDKLMHLFGRLIPILSLMFSMTLRFVPRYKAQMKKISDAQKCIGMDASHGNILQRIKNGVRIISILITWALENAIESADSMKARGFGLKRRTSFSLFIWRKRDVRLFCIQLFLLGTVLAGIGAGAFSAVYIPDIRLSPVQFRNVPFYLSYFLFCFLPVIADIKERMLWNRSESMN